ncbi:hypothetical protein AYI68_g6795, partial [Smittium mucronatum]
MVISAGPERFSGSKESGLVDCDFALRDEDVEDYEAITRSEDQDSLYARRYRVNSGTPKDFFERARAVSSKEPGVVNPSSMQRDASWVVPQNRFKGSWDDDASAWLQTYNPARKTKAEEEFERLNLYAGDANDTHLAVLRFKKISGQAREVLAGGQPPSSKKGGNSLQNSKSKKMTPGGNFYQPPKVERARQASTSFNRECFNCNRKVHMAKNCNLKTGRSGNTSFNRGGNGRPSNYNQNPSSNWIRRDTDAMSVDYVVEDNVNVLQLNDSTNIAPANVSAVKVMAIINQYPVLILLDTDVGVNFMSRSMVEKLKLGLGVPTPRRIRLVVSDQLATTLLRKVKLDFGEFSVSLPFYVVEHGNKDGLILLSIDVPISLKVTIKFDEGKLCFPWEGKVHEVKLLSIPRIPNDQEDAVEFCVYCLHESFKKEISNYCSKPEQGELRKLMGDYNDVFVESLEELGAARVDKCDVELLDPQPIKQKPYRLAHSLKGEDPPTSRKELLHHSFRGVSGGLGSGGVPLLLLRT